MRHGVPSHLFRLSGLLLSVLPLICHAAAPVWRPDKPVEIIVNTSPGTGSDATGRLIQRLLSSISDPIAI